MSKINLASGYRLKYRIKELLKPVTWFREVKRFMQRGINGYDETYHWSLDYEVLELILAVLPKYKDSGMSMFYYGEVVNEKERPEYERTWKITKRMDREARKLRDREIDFIIDHLQKYKDDDWSDNGTKAMELFAKRFGTWWD